MNQNSFDKILIKKPLFDLLYYRDNGRNNSFDQTQLCYNKCQQKFTKAKDHCKILSEVLNVMEQEIDHSNGGGMNMDTRKKFEKVSIGLQLKNSLK